MKPTEIEYRVLRIIEQVEAHQNVEDSRVELKSKWIDPTKAARQIAGQANAAKGENILWVFGVDEESGVCGTDGTEVSEWLNKVKSQYDDFPVRLQHNLTITFKGKSVVALLFETDRPPYVVKNPKGELPHREVPWREGNETRTATRIDLLKILSPLQLEPRIEVVKGEFLFPETLHSGYGNEFPNGLYLDLFVEPQHSSPITIAIHRCKAFLGADGSDERLEFERIFFSHSKIRTHPDGLLPSHAVTVSRTETTISNPGMLAVHATLGREIAERLETDHLEVDLLLGMTGLERKLPIRLTLKSQEDRGGPTRIWEMIPQVVSGLS